MLNRLAIVCKRVLAKCGFNCFKAAEHRGYSREGIKVGTFVLLNGQVQVYGQP